MKRHDATIKKILSDDDIEYIKQVDQSVKYRQIYQYHHLFGPFVAEKANGQLKPLDPIIEKIANFLEVPVDWELDRYLLNYVPGSFARMHHDNETYYTVVTPIETNNLVGGEVLVFNRYYPPEGGRLSHLICERHEDEVNKPPYNKPIIPIVLKTPVGHSMIYGAEQRHGVSKIFRGNRKVLVVWFKEK